MKAISFNINSVRPRLHQLQAVIDKYSPDFIGLQETKVNDPDFPLAAIQAMGYQVAFHGQKTHYGVALLSKHPFLEVIKGFPNDGEDSQKRFIGGRFASPLGGEITVLNGYFPQGESRDHPLKFPAKQKYYADLALDIAGSSKLIAEFKNSFADSKIKELILGYDDDALSFAS